MGENQLVIIFISMAEDQNQEWLRANSSKQSEWDLNQINPAFLQVQHTDHSAMLPPHIPDVSHSIFVESIFKCVNGGCLISIYFFGESFFIIYNWGRIKTLSLLFSHNKVTTSFTGACIVHFQFESLQTFLCIYNLDTFEKYLKQCPQFVNPPSHR